MMRLMLNNKDSRTLTEKQLTFNGIIQILFRQQKANIDTIELCK